MENGKIAVQMMMLKGKVQEFGVYETLRKLNELGFHAVEISQIPMTKENVAEFKRATEDFDMEIAALSATIESKPGSTSDNLTDHFQKIVDDCKALDSNYLRVGMLPTTILGDKDKIMDFIDQAESMAKRLDEHGINFYYHNHHLEFQKYDGEYLLDLIKNHTTKLGFEIDVHWAHRAGIVPVELIEQYAGRIALLHIKDYRIGNIDLTNVNDRATYQQRLHNIIEFAEIGEGNLNMKAIIDAGLHNGTKYFIIEQDNTYGRDPFESLQISANNLRKLGYADWF
ncbi:sugar phosphate isomerase [Oceanobacillus arenosus]|uniref:Sugar phosphate isomerase n=1 Tax=Oceanobacillus arenosus TaxID=1229153 RepID=A0A3D8PL97_9BACI|nr:sugar phosphate isomerase/epimerase [Oceanobacillus arenosus]RDW16011.1 sugar phosphate isomerase [Oceanobacillus arenosus]